MQTRQCLAIGVLISAAVTLAAGDALAERIRCTSKDYRYAFCDTQKRIVSARVAKRHSTRPCTQSRTWGWERDGIWVDDGCDADFEVVLKDFGPGAREPQAGPHVQGPPQGVNPAPWTVGAWRGQGYRLSVSRGASAILTSPPGGQLERGYMNGVELVLYDGTRLRAERDQKNLRLRWPNGRGIVLNRQ
jgi:hypothetical protein